jgi:hypothetical protein
MPIHYLLTILLFLFSSPTVAEDWAFGGHLKYHFTATHYDFDNLITQFGEQSPKDHFLDFRLNAENRWNEWDAKIHYEVLAIYGDTPETQNALVSAGLGETVAGLPNDKRRLFRLTDEWNNSEQLEAVQRLDRIYLGYNGEQLVLRAGRQTVSWGNGLVFHPLDIFSPFSPTQIDKDYKTGDDMLYGQWLFESGNDVQMILLPRRDPNTGDLESDQSSLAFKYRGIYWEEWDLEFLVARHFDENVIGFGLNKNVWDALWRFDMSATDLKDGSTEISIVTNMDYSWVWFEKNFYGFIEYFHNSLGETDSPNYLALNTALMSRIERGEVYTIGRDYLSSGVQIELTPLFNFYTNWISNLHDNSGIFQIRGIYDWTQNLQLIGWLDLPYGNKDSEFGGIAVGDTEKYLAPGQRIYLRLSYYF